jgi:hypothetical protein
MLSIDRLAASSLVVNACKGAVLVALVALMPSCVVDAESLDDVDVDPVPARTQGTWTGNLSTNDAPEYLWVVANSSSNSGTSNDLYLRYWNKSGKYSCNVTGTIVDGGARGCAPTRYGDYSDSPDIFKVGYLNSDDRNDALLVTEVSAEIGNAEYVMNTFTKVFPTTISCTGCGGIFEDEECNSCWIDGDDHKKCVEMKIYFASAGGTVECTSNL